MSTPPGEIPENGRFARDICALESVGARDEKKENAATAIRRNRDAEWDWAAGDAIQPPRYWLRRRSECVYPDQSRVGPEPHGCYRGNFVLFPRKSRQRPRWSSSLGQPPWLTTRSASPSPLKSPAG